MTHIGIYLPDQFAASLATTLYDYFQTANYLTPKPEFKVQFFSETSEPISYSGLKLKASPQVPTELDVLILIGTGGTDRQSIISNLQNQGKAISKILKKAHENGTLICSTCTAAFYLAESGLLNGKSATTAWWLVEDFKQLYPKVKWDERKSLLTQGRIISTGAGFTGLELAKTLLSRFKKNSLERKIHRILLLPERPIEQHPYVLLTQKISSEFAEKVEKLAKQMETELTPEAMASQLGMSHRTFLRKFKLQMKMTPGKWIQLKKIERAKELLMNQELTVEETCYQVGYEDPSSFIRLFQREVGLSPREFRYSFRK